MRRNIHAIDCMPTCKDCGMPQRENLASFRNDCLLEYMLAHR